MNKIFLKVLILQCFFLHAQTFDIQGHRGARGLMPENSKEGFKKALQIGVNTLELDVVITKDSQVVISHEPWMSEVICEPVASKNRMQYNIFKMTYEQVKSFDCGIKGNPRFPNQIKVATYKPLLSEMIDTMEAFAAANKLPPPVYNIETKSAPEGDNVFHPTPEVFVHLVYKVLQEKKILERCVIQSFDPRTLIALKELNCFLPQALLIANGKRLYQNLKKLPYLPAIYSPNYLFVSKKVVDKCHNLGIKVIPWTVNDEKEMLKMKSLGCDGLITDYPDLAVRILR